MKTTTVIFGTIAAAGVSGVQARPFFGNPADMSITNLLSKREALGQSPKGDHQAHGPDSVVEVKGDSVLHAKVLDHEVLGGNICIDVVVGGALTKQCKAKHDDHHDGSGPKPKPKPLPKPTCHNDREVHDLHVRIDALISENKRLQTSIAGFKHTIIDQEHALATCEAKEHQYTHDKVNKLASRGEHSGHGVIEVDYHSEHHREHDSHHSGDHRSAADHHASSNHHTSSANHNYSPYTSLIHHDSHDEDLRHVGDHLASDFGHHAHTGGKEDGDLQRDFKSFDQEYYRDAHHFDEEYHRDAKHFDDKYHQDAQHFDKEMHRGGKELDYEMHRSGKQFDAEMHRDGHMLDKEVHRDGKQVDSGLRYDMKDFSSERQRDGQQFDKEAHRDGQKLDKDLHDVKVIKSAEHDFSSLQDVDDALHHEGKKLDYTLHGTDHDLENGSLVSGKLGKVEPGLKQVGKEGKAYTGDVGTDGKTVEKDLGKSSTTHHASNDIHEIKQGAGQGKALGGLGGQVKAIKETLFG